PFPPPELPSFSGTTNLSATPQRPACPSRASSWSLLRPRRGASRVAYAFLVYMLSPLPRRSDWAHFFAHSPPAVAAFPERVIGSACASSFSRLARRSLALRPAHSRCHQFVTRFPKASAISSPP